MSDRFDWRRPAPARPYAEVIGDPIAQSKSPAIHGFWLGKLGIDAEYRAAHVKPEELADYIAARRGDANWRGCNVTMPHKQAVMGLVDRLDSVAQQVGAVNTVMPVAGKLIGDNTDVPGFAEHLLGRTFERALVIGAGGAARAVLEALRVMGVGSVALMNRSEDKARDLLDEFGLGGEALGLGEVCAPAGLLVNTSSLGMAGHPPLPDGLLDRVGAGGTVYDIVTTPLETELLKAAKARGFATIDGLSMLIGQADHAFRRFFGALPPREADAELRARITG